MFKIPIENPSPDFGRMVDILKGKVIPSKPMIAEILIDEEIKKYIVENYFNEKNCPPPVESWGSTSLNIIDINEKRKTYEAYYRQMVNFYYRMGYNLFADINFIVNFENLNTIVLEAPDTAFLSGQDRHWAVEGTGMIRTWHDFENFPWEKAYRLIEEYAFNLELLEKIVPDGMKIGIVATFFEEPLEWILGYEGFFYMIADQPDLVEAIYNKVGKIMYDFYSMAISSRVVGCIWHADDLGFKTSTMISVDLLNKWIFPWFKKYVEIAHKHEKPFFLHSCGNKDKIMDILINEVKIDAIHSFEDEGYPVAKYKKIWGDKIGIIGGIDIDKLVRYGEEDLRKYIRKTLEICMENGRYIFGSGNSICNYVPIKNYLIMCEEASSWGN